MIKDDQSLISMSNNLVDFYTKLEKILSPQVSDVHLISGDFVRLRELGKIRSIDGLMLNHEELICLCDDWLSEAQKEILEQKKDIDLRLSLFELGDFRVHIAHQHKGLSIALRPLPTDLPSLVDLGLPLVVHELIAQRHGLILVTGATGSGKSTSLTAMINHINQQANKHIITLEDPIERQHISQTSLIQQREIGRDCLTFADGLHSAMRQDPDVIMVGEMRDLATIRMVLTAAETGHLVLATLHSASASQAIDRMVDVFPAEEKAIVQTLLSQLLLSVIYQELTIVEALEGEKKRIALHEVLIATPAVRNLIREGKTAQLASVIQTGSAHGMQTLAQSRQARLAT